MERNPLKVASWSGATPLPNDTVHFARIRRRRRRNSKELSTEKEEEEEEEEAGERKGGENLKPFQEEEETVHRLDPLDCPPPG